MVLFAVLVLVGVSALLLVALWELVQEKSELQEELAVAKRMHRNWQQAYSELVLQRQSQSESRPVQFESQMEWPQQSVYQSQKAREMAQGSAPLLDLGIPQELEKQMAAALVKLEEQVEVMEPRHCSNPECQSQCC